MLDAIDSKAVAALQSDGRASWADLGTALGLSAPAAAERVRKLIDGGIVRGFTAVLDPPTAGFPVLAFVAVTLEAQGARAGFLDAVRRHDLIQECHHVAGDDDFLLKVRARSLSELESVLADELKGRSGSRGRGRDRAGASRLGGAARRAPTPAKAARPGPLGDEPPRQRRARPSFDGRRRWPRTPRQTAASSKAPCRGRSRQRRGPRRANHRRARRTADAGRHRGDTHADL